MDSQTFSNISKIIERDSKFSTYKFALLRGTIEIIQENSPYIIIKDYEVEIPLGLLIEKWIIYYYPILASKQLIPQINGDSKKLAFYPHFMKVIEFYQHAGGLSLLYNELRGSGISPQIKKDFISLVRSLRNTIVKQPMCYIGGSVNNTHYSIYKYQRPFNKVVCTKLNTQWLIEIGGNFTIPTSYYEAFKILGSFIAGTDSILFKWAEFSVNAAKTTLSTESVIHEILKTPVTERDSEISKSIYKEVLGTHNKIICVWSGNHVQKYDVDHLIPFAVWKNNDLWNLLPATPMLNNNKRTKIVSTKLLDRRKDLIIDYWEQIKAKFEERFFNEMTLSLTGTLDRTNWQIKAFNQLKKTSEDLINVRGYEEWSYTG